MDEKDFQGKSQHTVAPAREFSSITIVTIGLAMTDPFGQGNDPILGMICFNSCRIDIHSLFKMLAFHLKIVQSHRRNARGDLNRGPSALPGWYRFEDVLYLRFSDGKPSHYTNSIFASGHEDLACWMESVVV
jgi:hypothetical protein